MGWKHVLKVFEIIVTIQKYSYTERIGFIKIGIFENMRMDYYLFARHMLYRKQSNYTKSKLYFGCFMCCASELLQNN